MSFGQYVNVPSMGQYRQGTARPRSQSKLPGILEAIITGSLSGRRAHDERMERMQNQALQREMMGKQFGLQERRLGMDEEDRRIERMLQQEKLRALGVDIGGGSKTPVDIAPTSVASLSGGIGAASETPAAPAVGGGGEHPFVQALMGQRVGDEPVPTSATPGTAAVPSAAASPLDRLSALATTSTRPRERPSTLARMFGAADPQGQGLPMYGEQAITPAGLEEALGVGGGPAAPPPARAQESPLDRIAAIAAVQSNDPGALAQLAAQRGPAGQMQKQAALMGGAASIAGPALASVTGVVANKPGSTVTARATAQSAFAEMLANRVPPDVAKRLIHNALMERSQGEGPLQQRKALRMINEIVAALR